MFGIKESRLDGLILFQLLKKKSEIGRKRAVVPWETTSNSSQTLKSKWFLLLSRSSTRDDPEDPHIRIKFNQFSRSSTIDDSSDAGA